MPVEFYNAVGSIAIAFLLYTWIMIINYRDLITTKPQRLAARRLERAKKRAPYSFPR